MLTGITDIKRDYHLVHVFRLFLCGQVIQTVQAKTLNP
jgi:hypothetical protein